MPPASVTKPNSTWQMFGVASNTLGLNDIFLDYFCCPKCLCGGSLEHTRTHRSHVSCLSLSRDGPQRSARAARRPRRSCECPGTSQARCASGTLLTLRWLLWGASPLSCGSKCQVTQSGTWLVKLAGLQINRLKGPKYFLNKKWTVNTSWITRIFTARLSGKPGGSGGKIGTAASAGPSGLGGV